MNGSKKRIIIMAAMIVAAIIIVSAAWILLIRSGHIIPGWVVWNEKDEEYDPGYVFRLKNRELIIIDTGSGDGKEIYRTDPSLKISDFYLEDVDGDGDRELVTLLWKKGKYGEARPFWEEDDPKIWSQHIFIYDICLQDDPISKDRISYDKPIRQKWCTSELGREVKRWRFSDSKDNEGLGRPPATGTLIIEDRKGNVTLWAWSGFGLKNCDSSVSFAAFGDLIIHKDILDHGLNDMGGDYSFLFTDLEEDIKEADICAINLESVLVDDRRLYEGYPTFGAPVSLGNSISDAGIDIVTCANNHSLDKGPYGLKITSEFFDGDDDTVCIGIKDRDAEGPPYHMMVKNGISFALYGYTYGTNKADEGGRYAVNDLSAMEKDDLKNELIRGRSEADVVIVFVHWGDEYDSKPNGYQKEYARMFNECGVDVVIGSHPHVIQKTETLKNRDGHKTYVFYSLGNMKASQDGEGTRTGGEARFTVRYAFDGIEVSNVELKHINAYWR